MTDRDEIERQLNPDPHDVPGYHSATGVDDPVPDEEYGDQPEDVHPSAGGPVPEGERPCQPLAPGEHVDLDAGPRLARNESGHVYTLKDSTVRAVPLPRSAIKDMAELAGFEVSDR